MRTTARLVAVMAAVLLSTGVAAAPASGASSTNASSTNASKTSLYAPLHGTTAYPTATGTSYYYGMGMMGGRDVKVTVNHMTRLAGQRVSVYINGTRVGTMLVSSTGYAFHDWNGSFVPYCMGGSGVFVRTSGGVQIVMGNYR
jgi:hypothetical protein